MELEESILRVQTAYPRIYLAADRLSPRDEASWFAAAPERLRRILELLTVDERRRAVEGLEPIARASERGNHAV
jgi:hypothetical protein